MVVEYIRYSIDSERAQAFEQRIGARPRRSTPQSIGERYEISRCSDNPTQYVVCIDWDSEAGHLSGFRRSPEFRSFFDAVGPFVHDIV